MWNVNKRSSPSGLYDKEAFGSVAWDVFNLEIRASALVLHVDVSGLGPCVGYASFAYAAKIHLSWWFRNLIRCRTAYKDNLRQMPSTQFPFYSFWSKKDANALYHFLLFAFLNLFLSLCRFSLCIDPFLSFFHYVVRYLCISFFLYFLFLYLYLSCFRFFFFLWLRPCGGPGRCAESPWRSAAPVRSAMCFAGSRSSGVLIW